MDGNFGLMGSSSSDDGGDIGGGGGGGGVPSDESTTAGSILNTKKNQDISTEVSSPFPIVDHPENLELGYGLGIGGGSGGDGGGYGGLKGGQYAKDLPPSSSVKNPNLSPFGTSVVGWPPIRKGHKLTSQFKLPVKVKMEGVLIGRKVDLSAHNSFASLAKTLEDMFSEEWANTEATGPLKLLDPKSEFVLTYEDSDGDYMFVGDIPWEMFLSSAKRLRIMRNLGSNKFGNNKCSSVEVSSKEKPTKQKTDDA